MPLTAAIVRAAAPAATPYKLADEKGLFLYVAPTGLKSFRLKFRFRGAEKLLVLGSFPELSLTEARDRRDDARQLLRANVDPCEARKKGRASAELETVQGTLFRDYAIGWHERQAGGWSPEHAADVLTSLENDVFPAIGDKPIGAIRTPAIRELLRDVETRGASETARRIWQRVSWIFADAISDGIIEADPSAPIGKSLSRGAKKKRKRKQPAQTELAQARRVLTAAESAAGGDLVKFASRLLALTVVRPAVVRSAAWAEFEGVDWSTGEISPAPLWRIPPARMKLTLERKSDVDFEHLVPLSRQAAELLLRIRAGQKAGKPESQISGLLFPNARDRRRPISKNAIGELYGRAGFAGRHVPHGWRAAFSTIMNERYRADRAVIDLALAHQPKDKVEAAYNRADHLERRGELLQEWADLLLEPST